MTRRTLGWYAEHPHAFDEDVEAWQQRQLDAHLSGQDRSAICPDCGEHAEDCECVEVTDEP